MIKTSTKTNNEWEQREKKLIMKSYTDATAFSELYEYYVDKVYTYVIYRCGNKDFAEDIVADTFLKALKNIKKYKFEKGSFKSWLFRIAHNHMVDCIRKDKKHLTVDDTFINKLESDLKLEETVVNKEKILHIRNEVYKLPDNQREVIILKYVMELKNQEIASVMGKSKTAVSSLIFRTLNNLRDVVDI